MAHPAIRITFIDERAASLRWEAIGEELGNRVAGYARKRDGASHVLLLRQLSATDAQRIATWCAQQRDVIAVASIAESEFWSAPSNGV